MAHSNGYPYMTKNQIADEVATNREFAITCLGILCQRQTDDELESKTTKHTNKRGLRCSEASWMPALAATIHNGGEVSDDDWNRLHNVLPVYRKQLAAHFRAQQAEQNPDAAAAARVFGV